MVDVDSALRASAYSGKKRPKGQRAKDEEKKSRKIEPFDPAGAFEKEKADAFSMWLVILLGLSIGLFMRYVIMPTLTQPEKILWVLPLSLVVILPTLHRAVIPNKWSDLYDRGNWFRASFLYVFSWLAISFLLVNPPLADIAPPTLAGGLDIADADGIYETEWKGGEYSIGLDQGEAHVILGFAVRDNVDAEVAHLRVTLWLYGAEVSELANGTVSDLSEPREDFLAVENWMRGSKVSPHSEDIGFAFDLGVLGPNDYTVKIELSEEGDPWKTNSWKAEYLLDIEQTASA